MAASISASSISSAKGAFPEGSSTRYSCRVTTMGLAAEMDYVDRRTMTGTSRQRKPVGDRRIRQPTSRPASRNFVSTLSYIPVLWANS